MRRKLLLLIFLSGFTPAFAITWHVGPIQLYTAPSQVSTLVEDGDTVSIDAGTYESDVAHWTANNLLLKGAGGFAYMKANGANYGGKAIWVISGNNTTVDSIEFSLCTCADNNGAGIRQEGINLTVRHCFFHDNQEGILAGDNAKSDILIEYTEFYNNGAGDGYSHNLYINHVHSLTFQYNYSHHAIVGHELKSRAYNNYILCNRIANEETGTASREIDLPNGGLSYIIGNEIEQGPQSENSNIIGYGLEGLSNPSQKLFLINNTIVNDKSSGSFVNIQNGISFFKSYNNIYAGPGTHLTGTPNSIDTSSNLYCDVASVNFFDALNYDYHLTASSPAINLGIDPGFDSTFSLTPVYEYVYPTGMMLRGIDDSLDAGAHEYGNFSSAQEDPFNDNEFDVYPNPAQNYINIFLDILQDDEALLTIRNCIGEAVENISVQGRRNISVDVRNYTAGTYLVLLSENKKIITRKIVIR